MIGVSSHAHKVQTVVWSIRGFAAFQSAAEKLCDADVPVHLVQDLDIRHVAS